MKRRPTSFFVLAAATAALGASAAQAIPPPDPGVGVPGMIYCTVPGIRGVQLAAAKRRIAGAHCGLGLITRKRSSVKRGRVLSENPKPGTILAEGTQVDLLVSSGR